RRLGVPHAGVADQRQIVLELARIVPDEAKQMGGAALLLTLEHGGDLQRQHTGDSLVSAAGFNEGHRLTFVVTGTTPHDDLAPVGRGRDSRRERRLLPQIERVDRLHVVVAVEQDVRALAIAAVAFGDDDRMPLGWTYAGVETDAGEIARHELGRAATLVLVR